MLVFSDKTKQEIEFCCCWFAVIAATTTTRMQEPREKAKNIKQKDKCGRELAYVFITMVLDH